MARKLSSSVGRMGGRNLPQDVVTVQQLLNGVPIAEGGASPQLVVDGISGPKTINAIQHFQVKHFGFSGADGRVDPQGPTLAKLNEFDGRAPAQPAQVTVQTRMRCVHGGAIVGIPAQPVRTQILTTSDRFEIQACSFPTPCVGVRWLAPAGSPITASSQGLTLNAQSAPQGPVIIDPPQLGTPVFGSPLPFS